MRERGAEKLSNLINKTIKNGINLYFVKDDKFKTAALTVSFVRPLSKNEVTKNSLIPAVIRRGSKKYPETSKNAKKFTALKKCAAILGVFAICAIILCIFQ